MLVHGLRRRVPGAGIFLVGLLPLVCWGLLDAANLIGVPGYSRWRWWLILVALACPALAISVALARRFARTLTELDHTYKASYRFVPVSFFHLLGRRTINDVLLGDSRSLELTMMFCDIRGFTTMSQARTPEGSFVFINQFLAAMQPCIRAHGGFVVTYLGDGFMALFPAGEARPIAAAVAMQQALEGFNRAQVAAAEPAIRVGIGLHSGPVMVGTIGDAQRLYTGVVSDVVNIASRVEGLSKMYGAPLVVSSATHSRAGDGSWTFQELDAVFVKGSDVPLAVYEVLEGDPDAARQAAKRTERAAYSEALQAFRGGRLDEARAAFEALSGYARAGQLFGERCAWFQSHGLPVDWDGVVRLKVK